MTKKENISMTSKEFAEMLKKHRKDRYERCTSKAKECVNLFKSLSDIEKRDVLTFCNVQDIPDMKNPPYTQDEIYKIHMDITNLIEGYLNENGYKEIDALSLYMDGLYIGESKCEYMDSSLSLEHWDDEGRKCIGHSI